MNLDTIGNLLADTVAAAMLAHERTQALQQACRRVRAGRATKLAAEVRALTRHADGRACDLAVEYCSRQGLGLRQFEGEVKRRKIEMKEKNRCFHS